MKKAPIVAITALLLIVFILGCGNKQDNDNGVIADNTPDIPEEKEVVYVYEGTLNFTVSEKYVPTYKDVGYGIKDDVSTDYSIQGTVIFPNLTLKPEWNPEQEDYMYGNGYFTQKFQYTGSVFSKYWGYDAQDTFSGTFDDFAVIGKYVPKADSNERGIQITLLHPDIKRFNTPLAEFIEPEGSGSGPVMLTQQVTGDACYGAGGKQIEQLRTHVFDVQGGTYTFGCSYEDLQTPHTYHSWNATLTLKRIK